ncbi:MAG: AAA family ATPase [Deltaproteobacteria bacterium]|nr:AAA family ATPase [Deltaproteobacteria bacterium]
MEAKAALANDLTAINSTNHGFNEGLLNRLRFLMQTKGLTQRKVAMMLNRSTTAVSQYLNKVYAGSITDIEKDVEALLKKYESADFPYQEPKFCETPTTKEIFEVFRFCEKRGDMGVVIGRSGVSKTFTAQEFVRQDRTAVYIVCDITTRHCGAILYEFARKIGVLPASKSKSKLLHAIIDRLQDSRRLLIFDEAHFLTWEAFEAIRTIHDATEIGIVYLGQPRLYIQMRGKSDSYLWDQIFSRIGIRRHVKGVCKADVEIIARSIYPRIDGDCLDFLFKLSQGPGALRRMAKLLKGALVIHETMKVPVSRKLLREVNDKLFGEY